MLCAPSATPPNPPLCHTLTPSQPLATACPAARPSPPTTTSVAACATLASASTTSTALTAATAFPTAPSNTHRSDLQPTVVHWTKPTSQKIAILYRIVLSTTSSNSAALRIPESASAAIRATSYWNLLAHSASPTSARALPSVATTCRAPQILSSSSVSLNF